MITMDLTPTQARVIGCLIEKEITTPDQYPLSLNSLTNACNQKSNREPVMSLEELDVQNVLDELRDKRLIREETVGSRVVKYKHRFCNTEFSDLQLTAQELGVVCVMLLRGPQTPGELRTRTNRLCEFDDVKEVEQILSRLADRPSGALIVKLPREAGKRESRYAHLFCGEVDIPEVTEVSAAPSGSNDRIAELENRVAELERIIDELKAQL